MSGILAGRRILIVEDEMLVAMSIEDTLVDAGGEVIGPAPTVGQALGLLRDEAEIDAVVLDMNLQGHSGLPVADACDERSIPFLILSGYGETALSGSHHAAPILSKPFASAALVEALKALFEGSPT